MGVKSCHTCSIILMKIYNHNSYMSENVYATGDRIRTSYMQSESLHFIIMYILNY